MSWEQRIITLKPRGRGVHLVTTEIEASLPELAHYRVGLAHLMLLHTSAGIAINENADPDVRVDFETIFNRLVPEGRNEYVHTIEGPDDMPAHVKSVLAGTGQTVPIRDGRFLFGTWQGVYLLEFRNRGGARRLAVTITGEQNGT